MQQELTSTLEHSFKVREKSLDRYISDNVLEYIGHAKFITPSLDNWEMIWDRVAFAILSANCSFKQAVKALAYCTEHKGNVSKWVLMGFGMVSSKADYLNALWLGFGNDKSPLLKSDIESWQDYRLRLKRDVKGLGLAKASFAASLIYPLESDLACLDTWMQKYYLRRTFKQMGLKDYLAVEHKIRLKARQHGITTFLCQWLIWDSLRGSKNNHAIFPGSHKD